MNTFDKYDDVIDSRDIIARIEELTDERDTLQSVINEMIESPPMNDADEGEFEDYALELSDAKYALEDWSGADELAALESLQREAEGYCDDWHYGAPLIRYSYFKDYAMKLADDLGCMDSTQASSWPFTCIDWDQAAEELKQDYTSVDFDGVEYFIR